MWREGHRERVAVLVLDNVAGQSHFVTSNDVSGPSRLGHHFGYMVEINFQIGRAGAALGRDAHLQISLVSSVGYRQGQAGEFLVDLGQRAGEGVDRFAADVGHGGDAVVIEGGALHRAQRDAQGGVGLVVIDREPRDGGFLAGTQIQGFGQIDLGHEGVVVLNDEALRQEGHLVALRVEEL